MRPLMRVSSFKRRNRLVEGVLRLTGPISSRMPRTISPFVSVRTMYKSLSILFIECEPQISYGFFGG